MVGSGTGGGSPLVTLALGAVALLLLLAVLVIRRVVRRRLAHDHAA
jgi:hypothetical protein